MASNTEVCRKRLAEYERDVASGDYTPTSSDALFERELRRSIEKGRASSWVRDVLGLAIEHCPHCNASDDEPHTGFCPTRDAEFGARGSK